MEVDLPKIFVNFAKVHWMFMSLWVVGVLMMLVMPAPVQVTPEMEEAYDAIMVDANLQFGAKISAQTEKTWEAQAATNAAYGWFLNDRDTEIYNGLMAKQQRAEGKLRELTNKRDAMENVARSKVGLWSEYGLQAVRDKFWYMINEGTAFSKRSTWWDAIFMCFRGGSRDEGVMGMLLQLLMRFVMNFTIGMCGALVGFFWTLVSIVQSFNPDTGSAILFYCVAGLAAVSMVGTIVFALYGTVGGTVYVVAKAAANQQRLDGRAGGPRMRVQGGRPGGFGGAGMRQGYPAGGGYGGGYQRPHYQ